MCTVTGGVSAPAGSQRPDRQVSGRPSPHGDGFRAHPAEAHVGAPVTYDRSAVYPAITAGHRHLDAHRSPVRSTSPPPRPSPSGRHDHGRPVAPVPAAAGTASARARTAATSTVASAHPAARMSAATEGPGRPRLDDLDAWAADPMAAATPRAARPAATRPVEAHPRRHRRALGPNETTSSREKDHRTARRTGPPTTGGRRRDRATLPRRRLHCRRPRRLPAWVHHDESVPDTPALPTSSAGQPIHRRHSTDSAVLAAARLGPCPTARAAARVSPTAPPWRRERPQTPGGAVSSRSRPARGPRPAVRCGVRFQAGRRSRRPATRPSRATRPPGPGFRRRRPRWCASPCTGTGGQQGRLDCAWDTVGPRGPAGTGCPGCQKPH